jgi:DNA excision repair protein ERCC-3
VSNLATHDYSHLPLKSDHASRPIWVCEDGRVFLETYNPLYRQAYDFLIAIADPVTRPQFIHEYQITSYSLYAAASLGLDTEAIIHGLNMFSKVALSAELCNFIHEKTVTCGKAKLVLKKTRYFVESIYPDTLRALLQHPLIAAARIDNKERPSAEQLAAEAKERQEKLLTTTLYSERLALQEANKRHFNERIVRTSGGQLAQTEEAEVRDEATGFLISAAAKSVMLPGTASQGSKGRLADSKSAMGVLGNSTSAALAAGDDESSQPPVLSFEIDANSVEDVRKTCNELNYGMIEEYDFSRDTATPDLPIALRSIAHIRDYQEKSLSKMFGCGRARSGIIVLPCGAGFVHTMYNHAFAFSVHTLFPCSFMDVSFLPLCCYICL